MFTQKDLFYSKYISSGQAGKEVNIQQGLLVENYPQYVQWIKKHLPDNKELRIVDLGCGYGALVYCLKELGYHNVVGVDYSSEQVELAHQLGVQEVEQGDIETFLTKVEGQFDIVFLIDVLEHLTRVELISLLSKIYQLLTNSGKIIIHVPNAEGIFGMRIRYGDITHEECFTPKSIQQIMRIIGFNGVQTFEDKPIVHGFKSWIRAILWKLLTLYPRLLLIAETGETKFILSQNMIVTAQK